MIAAAVAVPIAGILYLVVRPTSPGDSSRVAQPPSSSVADASPADAAAEAAATDEDPTTLAAAIARARPLMVDGADGSSAGTLVLLGWSSRHLRWDDVAVDPDETSYELVQKDPDGQRGKRLCVSGTIAAMNPVRTDAALFWNGVLNAPRGRRFAFLAVASAGALADGSPARLCGVVTGRSNVAGPGARAAKAVVLVGMFDLPENRALDRR